MSIFANRTLALKETSNSITHSKKNKNYNKILEKPFIFNLLTVSMVRRRFHSFPSQFDVVGCGQKVAEWVKKTTSVPETKKKEELPMKLLDDVKICTTRRNPRSLDFAAKMGLKSGDLIARGVTTTT
jgi:hypothetical protein